MTEELIYSVTDFVAICNQVLDISFGGSIKIEGELASYKVSKNKWLFFDLKDSNSTLKFFGNVYQLPSPLAEGMILQIRGYPVLHPKFGFSINIQSIQLAGEGSIKKSALLLEQKLEKEGLFDPINKRHLPRFPTNIGVISSKESAGFKDFIKITNQRWGGLKINLIDVQVQGENAPGQIISAIEYFNQTGKNLDVLVIIRGGGSMDDLQAYNHEKVVRSIAGSKTPTLVAIGHETDVVLAEKVADLRASTPSHASQLLVPDKNEQFVRLKTNWQQMSNVLAQIILVKRREMQSAYVNLANSTEFQINESKKRLQLKLQILEVLNPEFVLSRGYAIVRQSGRIIDSASKLNINIKAIIQFKDAKVRVNPINMLNEK